MSGDDRGVRESIGKRPSRGIRPGFGRRRRSRFLGATIGFITLLFVISVMPLASADSEGSPSYPCNCYCLHQCPAISIFDVSASGDHTVVGTQGTVSWQVQVMVGSLSSTDLTCGESGCSTSGVSQSGSTYSQTISGLSPGISSHFTIYATTCIVDSCPSTYYSGSFVPTSVAPSPSYYEWNPSLSFNGQCGIPPVVWPVSATITPHFNDYQPGDFVYVPNAAQGQWTTYDLQAGVSVQDQGWCPGFNLDLTGASVSIVFVDASNSNDNFANWMQVSNSYTVETSSTGMGSYTWCIGLGGQYGGGSVSLGASYQAPSSVSYGYTVQQSNLGGGEFAVSTLSGSFPTGGGSQYMSAVLPIHILDTHVPSSVYFDNIQVQYIWT